MEYPMSCPECGSEDVYEINNQDCIWGCKECGYQGDGYEFDTECRVIERMERKWDPGYVYELTHYG